MRDTQPFCYLLFHGAKYTPLSGFAYYTETETNGAVSFVCYREKNTENRRRTFAEARLTSIGGSVRFC